jgi:tetratricopeptide (TPR) repeat protein
MYCEERAYENVKELLSFCQGVQVIYNTIDNLNLYDLLSIGRCYVELGELYSVQQNHEQALENYKQALYWCSFVKLDESLPNKLDSPEFSTWSTVVQNVSA